MKFNDASKVFFTSDTHFGHKAIIEYCKRPYKSVEEMNQALIDNWNRVVPKDGVVFHLGDIVFGGSKLWEEILPQLNGTIYLVKGNHDEANIRSKYTKYFADIKYQYSIEVEGQKIYLNHYPFLCYSNNQKVWQLFGHVHSGPNCNGSDSGRLQYLYSNQYDVGVDNNNYTPISFLQVKEKLSQRKHQNVWTRIWKMLFA